MKEMKTSTYPAIAIDGPAASGKSTVAKLIAAKLNYCFINTGAMYRAVTWYCLEEGVDPQDQVAVKAILGGIPITFGRDGAQSCILFKGQKLGEELTKPEVNEQVSTIAAIGEVRQLLVAKQREYNLSEPVVMEGRDIGSVVFPNTPFKYFVTASEEVREARRRAEGISDSIAQRDQKDSQRTESPLVQAEGAKLIDSSEMSIDEVVASIIDDIESKL